MNLHEAVRSLTFPRARTTVRRHIGSIDGLHNIPREGAFVLVPNHTSYFDHFVAITLVELVRGVPLWILTKDESFRHAPRRVWTKAWYGIPVNRDSPAPSTIRAVHKAFAASEALGVYPEGTRGTGDQLLPFKPGAFRFALKGGVPVVPMAMIDTNVVLPPGSLRFRRGRVTVAIGSPLWPDGSLSKEQQAIDLAARCRTAVEELLEVAVRNRAGADGARIPADGARLIDRIIIDHLDQDSRLATRWRMRATELTRLYLAWSPRDVHLLAQQARIAGLRVSGAALPLRLARAARVRRMAERVLAVDPDEFTANYVLGRWHLGAPGLLGGRLDRAEAHFRRAAAAAPPGESRALVGLGEALEAQGNIAEARTSFAAAIAATGQDHPRAAVRTARLSARLEELEVHGAEAARH